MKIKEAISQSFVKVYNFVQREFAYLGQIDYSGKFLPFGDHNAFPQQLADLVKHSPTATSCLSTMADFIAGEGFNQGEPLENLVINSKGQKFFSFHCLQSAVFTQNWGVASLVKYNRAAQITEIYDIPFGYCRLGQPDDNGIISKIHYNPYFGTIHYQQKDTIIYDVYNPDAAPVQMRTPKWPGQIFWLGIRDGKNPHYPEPDYYSASRWMRIEKNAAVYFDENLESGFLTPAILKLYGNPNEPSGQKDDNDNDISKGKLFDTEMTKNFSGAKRVGQLWAFWADNKEEFPTVEAFPSNQNAEMHRVTDEHAIKKITIATKVPAILANISEGVSLGGDGNTIRAAVKLMQQRVKRPQSILIDYYTEMLRRFVNYKSTDPITIVPYNPFPEMEAIDPQVWTELSKEERRQWVNDHTEIQLNEPEVTADPTGEPQKAPADDKTLQAQAQLRGSVGGVQGVLQIQQGVVAGTTTVESALSILTIIFGFTQNEARRLLGQPEETAPAEPVQNRIVALHFNTYPKKARENVKRALDWQEKMQQKCSKPSGRMMSEAILNGTPLGPKEIKRLSRYLSKQTIYASHPYDESCESVLYDAWGGSEMMVWANEKVKELNGEAD